MRVINNVNMTIRVGKGAYIKSIVILEDELDLGCKIAESATGDTKENGSG